ncbi:MAG: DHA2 family efflux MFS transporter permease subunit [Acidimicrobiia bacterium]
MGGLRSVQPERTTLLTYRSQAGRWALIVTILGSGMAFIDGSAVNVALRAISQDLGADLADLQWVITGYLLTLGALVLVGGSLGDLYGKRKIFVVGVIWFAAASILCGLAWSTTSLILFRIAQGVGAALLVPNSLALIQAVFVPADRATAIGIWSGFSGVTALVGPFLGGWLTDAFSWRFVFLINPVLAAPTLLLALRFIPETHIVPKARPDIAGGLTATIGLGAIVYALIEGPVRGWDDPAVIAAAVVGIVALVAFGAIERTSDTPMVPFRIFSSRQFSGANLYTLAVYAVLYGTFSFFFALQLLNVLGYSALEAGLAAFVPVTLLLLIISPAAGRLATLIGPRIPMMVGPALSAGGAIWLAGISQGTPYWSGILPGVVLFGVGLGLLVTPLTATVLAAVSQEHVGLASGFNNSVARLAGLLAIVLIPLVAGLAGLQDLEGEAYSAGYERTMYISAGLLLLGTLIAGVTIREPLIEEEAPA